MWYSEEKGQSHISWDMNSTKKANISLFLAKHF